jgi:hypothetical protein
LSFDEPVGKKSGAFFFHPQLPAQDRKTDFVSASTGLRIFSPVAAECFVQTSKLEANPAKMLPSHTKPRN